MSTGKRLTPQARDILWFQKLRLHGPLPSSFLLAYSQATHKSRSRALERLTDLFNEDNTPDGGAYLTRPKQQFRTIDSRYQPLVYDLAPAGEAALIRNELAVPPLNQGGPWLHRFMTSCITASIELATLERDDLSFIPGHAVLARAGAELRFPTEITDPQSGQRQTILLIPDALFGLEYHTREGSRFRFFVVEADRATEPLATRNWNRKSALRNLRQYAAYIGEGRYREHLQLTAPLLVLNVSTDAARQAKLLRLVAEAFPDGCPYQLFQTWEAFGEVWRVPGCNTELMRGLWKQSNSKIRIEIA